MTSSKRRFTHKDHANVDAGKVYAYGTHALSEALEHAPHAVRKAFLAPNAGTKQMRALLAQHKIPTSELSSARGAELVGRDAVHQGVIAVIDPSALFTPLGELLETLDLSKNPALAVLGEVQDPHNVGAIIRSAAAFGLAGVLIPEHNQARITGTVLKTSAGMAFRTPLVSINNVNTVLARLKESGFWIYGLSAEGNVPLTKEAFAAPAVFVVGNEGRGIREKTLAACDISLSIPMHPRTESLNAAVSAGVTFYAWSAKHPEWLA